MEPVGLLTAEPGCTVAAAAQRMAESRCGAILVVDGDGTLRGIFTPIDAVRRVLARGIDAHATPLAAVMTQPVRTVEPGWTLGHALKLMQEHGLRQLPVVEDGKAVGIVRAREALDPEMEEFNVETKRREGYAAESTLRVPAHKV